MGQAWRILAGALAAGALAGGSTAFADDGGGRSGGQGALPATTVFTIDRATDAEGNPEGIAYDKRRNAFYVSRVGSGAIFRGTLDDPVIHPFIGPAPNPDGAQPPIATGLKVRGDRLYVAGAQTGTVRIYDLDAPAAAPRIIDLRGADTTSPTFINDLDVTRDGDVFATDSFRPVISRIDGDTGAVTRIDVSAKIPLVRNPDGTPAFNLNGIVAKGDDELITVNSALSKLYRIDLGDDDRGHHGHGDDDRSGRGGDDDATPGAPEIQEITLSGGSISGGDGLLFDRGRLIVVQGSNPAVPNGANGVLTFIELRHHRTRGTIVENRTDPTLAGPSTVARARDRLLVVNANFSGDGPPFTVSGLARGDGDGHHGGGDDRHGRHHRRGGDDDDD